MQIELDDENRTGLKAAARDNARSITKEANLAIRLYLIRLPKPETPRAPKPKRK